MRGWRSAKISTIREEFDEINDSMKASSSRMKNKVGAQKGAFIKMKQENSYIYQRVCVLCYVPIIAPPFLVKSSSYYCSVLLCSALMCILRVADVTKLRQLMINIFVSMS